MNRDNARRDAGLETTMPERSPKLVNVFLVGILFRNKSSSLGVIGAKDASSSRNIDVIQVENNPEQVEKSCRFGLIPLVEVGPIAGRWSFQQKGPFRLASLVPEPM